MLDQPAPQRLRIHRSREVVALGEIAAEFAHRLEHNLVLDALGDDLHAERMPDLDRRPHECRVGVVLRDAFDIGAVELEVDRRQQLQRLKR